MSSIIYEPAAEILNLREIVSGGIVQAGILAAVDFIAGDNKPWSYYAGVFSGAAAVATGIPGAAATLYVVGDVLDAYVFKTPDSSDLRIFLNGVQVASLETYALTEVWEAIQSIALDPNKVNRVDFVHNGPGLQAASFGWLALSNIIVTGTTTTPQVLRSLTVAHDTLVFRFKDSESDTRESSIPVYLPTGFTLAQVQTYSDAIGLELDALTGAQMTTVEITFQLTLPAGVKNAPVAASLNERGGLITFDTSGPRSSSIRIPAMSTTIMPGDSFALTNASVAALITRLTTQTTAANVRPVTDQGHNWVTARKGAKSFRK